MQTTKRYFGVLLAVAMMLGLGACAALSAAQVEQIEDGKPALILSFRESSNTTATLTVVNLLSGTRYDLSPSDIYNNPRPSFIMVETGRYRVISGVSEYYNAIMTLPLARFWFKDFDVNENEIVDLGTLSFDVIEAPSQANALDGIANALFKFDPRNMDNYVTYSVDDFQDARVRDMLAKDYPTLAAKRVKRPLEVVIDNERFRQLVLEAHKPKQDGSLPTTEEARKQTNQLLAAFLIESGAIK